MKLISRSEDRFLFGLGSHEKELLVSVLKLYPRIPPAHQRLSKTANAPDLRTSERLLEDALAEHRAESKRQLTNLLVDPNRLARKDKEWQLSLSPAEFEWLLQVLNDVRVGSWLALGSPEELLQTVTEHTAPHLWAMEMAGTFQMYLLGLVEGAGS